MRTIPLNMMKSIAIAVGVGLCICSAYAGYPSPTYVGPASRPDLTSLPAYSVSADGPAPVVGAPEIAEWGRINGPGDKMVLTGSGFAQDMSFEVYGQGAGFLNATVEQVKDVQARVQLPSGLPADQMYLIWPKNAKGYGNPVAVNRTDAWWIGPSKVRPGKTFSVYGRNLQLGNEPVRLFIQGPDRWLTSTTANPYKADFVLPSDIESQDYSVWVHNGSGGDYGWSTPLTLNVESPTMWSSTVINVKDYGAKGDGIADDHDAIVSAISYCPPYGTIHFPKGTYALGSKIKMGITNKRLKGDGPNSTIITTHSSYSEDVSYGMIHADLVNVEVKDMGFESGVYNSGIGVRCKSAQDTKWINCRFSDWGSPSQKNNLEVQNSRNLTFSDCEFVTWKGTYMAGCDGLFVTNCIFKGWGDVEAGYLVSISGADQVSIIDSVAQHYDNSDYTDGKGWCQGRFVLMDGNFGTSRHVYIGGNKTIDMAPRYNFDIGWYSGQPHQNAGEQVLAEHQRTRFRGAVSGATAASVTCPALTNSYTGQIITIIGGRGFGQSRLVSSIDTAVGKATVSEPWNVAPDSSSTVAIGLYINRVIVYGNHFDGPRHVSLPINTENNTPPYDTNSHPRQTASTAVSFYGGCSESVVSGNLMTEVGSGMCNWSVMDDSASSITGVSVAQPNYFNLFENNTIDRCQNVFKNVAFNTASEPFQGDIAIFNATFRNNRFDQVADTVVAESTTYPEVSIEQSIYEGNVQGVVTNSPEAQTSLIIEGPSEINEGAQELFLCMLVHADGTKERAVATWNASDPFFISPSGLLEGGSVSQDTIVTISAAYNGMIASKTVTVKNLVPLPTSISLDGADKLNEGDSQLYTCTAYYSDGTSEKVVPTWNVTTPFVIYPFGLLVTGSVDRNQTVTVSASYQGLIAQKEVVILDAAPELTSIQIVGDPEVSEEDWSLYTCIAYYSDGTSKKVQPAWSVSSPFTIYPFGLLATGSVNSDQYVTVSVSYGGLTATKAVKVIDAAPVLTGIAIEGQQIVEEESWQFYTCYAQYSDGSRTKVTPAWSINDDTFLIHPFGLLELGLVDDDHTVTLTASYEGLVGKLDVTVQSMDQIVYPLSGFEGKWLDCYLWDETANEYTSLGVGYEPEELVVQNLDPTHHYWLGIRQLDESTGKWPLIHGCWIEQFNEILVD